MAKKKRGFHGIHIHPKAGTHYEVRHDPKMEPDDKGQILPSMGDDEDNTRLFAHGERDKLHAHLDKLMDAHEGYPAHDGVKDSPAEEKAEMPADHPMHRLKARRPY